MSRGWISESGCLVQASANTGRMNHASAWRHLPGPHKLRGAEDNFADLAKSVNLKQVKSKTLRKHAPFR